MSKLKLIIGLSILVAIYAVYLICLFIAYAKENKKGKAITECPKKKKRKLPKTYYEEKIKDLRDNISYLEDYEINQNKYINELRSLIYAIRIHHIDLKELEELGLQRYNAKYGEVKHNNTCYGEITTFVSEELYNELSKFFLRSYTISAFSYSRGKRNEKRNHN